jgi:microsomal dipeptidase-like Zn-dependent dipeptidase
MTDDMIRDLAKNGGVIQINYHVGFVSQQFRDFEKAHPEAEKEIRDEANKRCGGDEDCAEHMSQQVIHDFMRAGKLPKVDWSAIVEHM